MPNVYEQFENESAGTPLKGNIYSQMESAPTTPEDFLPKPKPSLYNTTPFQMPDHKGRYAMPASPFGMAGSVEKVPWNDTETKAAQSGVDMTSGAPYKLRNLVDLGTNPTEKIRAIQRYLVDNGMESPQGVPGGRIGPESGVPEYYNKTTGRYTAVTAAGMPFSSAPTLPEIGTASATMGGAALATPGTLGVGTAVGAGAGRFLAEIGKKTLNAFLGNGTTTAKPGEVDTDFVKDAAKQGGKEALLSLAGSTALNIPTVLRYARYGPKLFSSQAFNPKYWAQIKDRMADADKTLEDYYTLAGNKNLSLDVAQKSDHPAVTTPLGEAVARREDNMVEYELRGQNNYSNLQQTFNNVTKAHTDPAPIDPGSSGPAIAEWQGQRQAAAQAKADLEAKTVADGAKREVDGLPKMGNDQVNQRVTEQLQLVEKADKATLDKSWGDLAVKLGKPASVAYSKDSDWLLSPQLKTADFTLSRTGQVKLQNLIDEAVQAGKTDKDFMGAKLNAIPSGFIKNGAEGKIEVDSTPRDMFDVINTIKGIRAGVRSDMKRFQGQIPPNEQDAAKVAEILRNDVTDQLERRGDPSILDALETAEDETARYAARWRQSVLSEAAKKKDGFSTPVLSAAVNQALFQSGKDQSKQAISELAGIAKGDPEMADSIRQSILSIYKGHYTDQGLPTTKLHQKFLDDFEGPLSQFFSGGERAQIDRLGTLGDVVAKRSAQAAELGKQWASSPFGKLGAMNTATISKAAFSNAKGVIGIGNFLRQNNPELLKQLQSDTAQQVATKVFGSSGQSLNQSALGAVIDPVRGRGVREIMGPEYVDNLRTISTTARMLTGSKSALPEENTLIHRAVRLVTGAFGPEARAYHLIRGFRERQASRMMFQTLSDPDKMARFMAMKSVSPQTAKKAGLGALIGGNTGWMDQTDNQPE